MCFFVINLYEDGGNFVRFKPRNMKIIIKKSRRWMKQRYHFVVKSRNGKVICVSEKYTNLQDCELTARLLMGRNIWLFEYEF